MNISKKLEPIVMGVSAAIIIGVLSILSFKTSTGLWLMISFGATSLVVFVFHDKEFAQPGNIFFGHLLGIIIGILFNEFIGMSVISLGLSVGITITLMIYLKVIHPPAAANPLIALFGDVSLNFVLFPVVTGAIVIILISIVINKFVLKRKYPVRWF
jgi:CBS-domain-containing membrane protein